MAQQMSAEQMVQMNLYQRQMLIATSPVYNKNIGTNTQGTLGGTSRIKLFNVGLAKRLILQVSMRVDIGTLAGTLSAKAPFNLINRIQLIDYAGNSRVNISGMHLFMVNTARYRTYFSYNNEAAPLVLPNPVIPTATGTNQLISFFIEVPIAYSDTDLRGLINMQTAIGEMQLNIDWNASLITNGNDDSVYNGTGTTTVVQTAGTTINTTVVQEYFAPQANPDGTIYLPQLDSATIYELNGNIRSSDNIISNQERLISFPNLRSVIGLYIGYRNNSLMDSTNVVQHNLYVNGNNKMLDRPNQFQLMEQRRWNNSDTRAGQFFYMFRDRPIETSMLGNVQLGITPATVTGVADIEQTFESFFTTGQLLPGMQQAQ